jgi:hypothetical protein
MLREQCFPCAEQAEGYCGVQHLPDLRQHSGGGLTLRLIRAQQLAAPAVAEQGWPCACGF